MRATAVPDRRFPINGPCDPQSHHLLDPLERLPAVAGRPLAGRLLGGASIALQAPPAAGRTTALRGLAAHLRSRGAIPIVIDAHGLDGDPQPARAEARLLDQLRRASRGVSGGGQPAPWRLGGPWQMLAVAIDDWARRTDRPLVVLVDDLDRMAPSVAGTLRAQLASSAARGVLLTGIDDPRGPGTGRLGRRAEHARMAPLTRRELGALYGLHAADGGQTFTEAALVRAVRWTGGHPWLACALARELIDGLAVQGVVGRDHVDRAAARLLQAWPPWFDRLTAALDEPAVRRATLPLVAGTAPVGPDAPGDIERARSRGLLASEAGRPAGALHMGAVLRALGRALGGHPLIDPRRCRRNDGGVELPRVVNLLASNLSPTEAPPEEGPGRPSVADLIAVVRSTRIVDRLLPPGGVAWQGGYGTRQLVGRIDLPLTGRRRQQAILAIKRRGADEPQPLERGLSEVDRLAPPGGEAALVLLDHHAGRARLTWEVAPSGREVLVLRI